jgi:hypothetical protein
MPLKSKSAGRDQRAAKARAVMRAKGYLQVGELARKLTAETSRNVTVSALTSHHKKGRLEGVVYKDLLFLPENTKLPDEILESMKVKEEPVPPFVLGPWANWPAPQVKGARAYPPYLGWFGSGPILPGG